MEQKKGKDKVGEKLFNGRITKIWIIFLNVGVESKTQRGIKKERE